MKKIIKKTIATTLSIFGILSAMPSVFCAPDAIKNLVGFDDRYNFVTLPKGTMRLTFPVNMDMDHVLSIMKKKRYYWW